jgi:hypothetical protein
MNFTEFTKFSERPENKEPRTERIKRLIHDTKAVALIGTSGVGIMVTEAYMQGFEEGVNLLAAWLENQDETAS